MPMFFIFYECVYLHSSGILKLEKERRRGERRGGKEGTHLVTYFLLVLIYLLSLFELLLLKVFKFFSLFSHRLLLSHSRRCFSKRRILKGYGKSRKLTSLVSFGMSKNFFSDPVFDLWWGFALFRFSVFSRLNPPHFICRNIAPSNEPKSLIDRDAELLQLIWLVSFFGTFLWNVSEGLGISIGFATLTVIIRTQWWVYFLAVEFFHFLWKFWRKIKTTFQVSFHIF